MSIYTLEAKHAYDNDAIKNIVDKGVFPIVFGGDHSITFPIIDAFNVLMDIIHFDTHFDFLEIWPM